MIARFMRLVESVKARGRAVMAVSRVRYRWIDHIILTIQRYQVQGGDRLAGAVTYFAFLSFFPLIALAFAIFGYVVSFGVLSDDARATLTEAIKDQLPGLADQIGLDRIAEARVGAGIIGLVGLLYAGLGALDALRTALRLIWMTTEPQMNFFLRKARDLAALLALGLMLILTVVVSGFANGATAKVAGWLGIGGALGEFGLAVAGIAVSLAADVLLFLIIFWWIARPQQPFRTVLRGALLGAVLFGALRQLATLLLSTTLNNPVYGTFAVIVGLLIWINLSSRVILYSAAWTATALLRSPPEPTPIPDKAVYE